MRIREAWAYFVMMLKGITQGSWQVVRSAWFGMPAAPAILEMSLGCRSDIEISLFTASIAITPGTIVLGVAAGRGDDNATIFVHSVYDNDRERVMEELKELEASILDLFRGRHR